MKTTKEVIREEFGEDLSGYIYATPSQLEEFYEKTWDEAIDAAIENVEIESFRNYPTIRKESLLKLKKRRNK